MKKSTHATGNAYQRWCAEVLKELIPGCVVHNQTPVGMFLPGANRWISKRNDIFGCDLICIAPDRQPLFVQCTTHKSFNEKLKELSKIPWNLHYTDVWVMLKREGGRTEVRKLINSKDSNNPEYFLTNIGYIIRRKWVS